MSVVDIEYFLKKSPNTAVQNGIRGFFYLPFILLYYSFIALYYYLLLFGMFIMVPLKEFLLFADI